MATDKQFQKHLYVVVVGTCVILTKTGVHTNKRATVRSFRDFSSGELAWRRITVSKQCTGPGNVNTGLYMYMYQQIFTFLLQSP